jgi:hypothetical protein
MRNDWTFSAYIEEIIMLSEIAEIPGIAQKRALLLREVWHKFPVECEGLGLRNGVK